MIRKPAVAHQFYPGDAARLRRDMEKLTLRVEKKESAIGIMAPHAGYVYSGVVAGEVYSRLIIPENVVIICPNHTGIGSRAAIMSGGVWEMPMGDVQINSNLAERIMEKSNRLEEDPSAHSREHSLEVQLPFLRYFNDNFKMVPVCLTNLSFNECEEIGMGIARSIVELNEPVLIVASSDMTHYEPQKYAKENDRKALKEIEALNPKGLLDVVRRNSISMCGVIPTTVMLIAAVELGAKSAQVIKYATSGDVSGDYAAVVGYAGVVVR